jgi:sodium transport system ATP-binding protein
MLSATHISKAFGNVKAVLEFSMEVHPGEVVGLLGPNGAGKTTILRMLAGILTPDTGNVEVSGIRMSSAPLEAKRRLGFLSGDTQLYQRLTPREMLEYFGRLYEYPPDRLPSRVERLIEELGMESFARRPCRTLSAGQKQRCNIARAFLHEPDVLILDEPTNALDVVSGRFIVDSIRRKRHEGRSVLFSTHVMGEAEYLCDRIILLHEGRVVEQGALAEILERSGHRNLTDAFFAAIGEPVEAS